LDDVFKLALKVEKRAKEKKIFTKLFPKEQASLKPPFKPFIHPKPEGTSRVNKGKAVALHQSNCLRSLRERSALNVKGTETSNMIVLTEGS